MCKPVVCARCPMSPRMLDRVVPDDEFVAMLSAANVFRTTVNTLGPVAGLNVDNYVRARLYWNPKVPELPTGHEALANEILVVLGDSRLSSPQILELEREYFPRRRV